MCLCPAKIKSYGIIMMVCTRVVLFRPMRSMSACVYTKSGHILQSMHIQKHIHHVRYQDEKAFPGWRVVVGVGLASCITSYTFRYIHVHNQITLN